MSSAQATAIVDVDALVAEQKKIYVNQAARGSKGEDPRTRVTPAVLEARNATKHTTDAVEVIDDTFLYLHFILLGGPRYIKQFLTEISAAGPCSDGEGDVEKTAAANVIRLLQDLEDDIQAKKQWLSASEEDSALFRWRVVFATYVLRALDYHEVVLDPASETNANPSRASKLGPRCQVIAAYTSIWKSLKNIMKGNNTSKGKNAQKAWSDLCDKAGHLLPPGDNVKRFKDARTTSKKAGVLLKVWEEMISLDLSGLEA